MFKRVLIANRGEIAVRIIRCLRELNIESVVVYSEADKESLPVMLAGKAVCIGPASAKESYLNGDILIEVALKTECDALHPGYGFLLSFSLWTYLALALVFGLLLFHFQKNRKKLYIGILCFFLLPSVGNMSLTMKTDLFTLLLQLSALYFFLKGKRLQSCFLLFFSYSFKPTAVGFFSPFGIGFFFTMLLECFGKRNAKAHTDRNTNNNANINANSEINSNTNRNRVQAKAEKWTSELPFVLFSVVYTGLITLRTFLITGLPFSTTFTGIFKAIGFHVNWPFNLDAHVDYSGERSLSESAFSFFRRLFSFLFYPVGEDMEHVAIAWSGVLFPLILLFALWQCISLGRMCFLVRKNSLARQSFIGRKSFLGQDSVLSRENEDASPWDYLPLALSFLVIMAFSLLSFCLQGGFELLSLY